MSGDFAEIAVSAHGLPGTYLRPAAPAKAAALFVSGSGPTDRDGNSVLGVRAGTLAKLARALAAAGISSLRYDKRGLAGSLPVEGEHTLNLQTFVDDAALALDWLCEEAAGLPVAVIGHSEGGLIGLELAARCPDVGRLVLLATPGRPMAETLAEQLRRFDEPLRGAALEILARLQEGEYVETVPEALMPLFRPSVQPFLRSLFTIDPPALLRALERPVLVVGGGRDIQVGRTDFDRLAAVPGTDTLWLDTMNHVLTAVASDDQASNFATYADPDIALAPGLSGATGSFLLSGRTVRP